MVESDGVPLLVKKCVHIIEENGLKTEGIYRVSGKKEDIMALQDKYDEGMCNLQVQRDLLQARIPPLFILVSALMSLLLLCKSLKCLNFVL